MTLTLAANLSTLYTETPFLTRFARAAKAGFRWVECQFPYEAPPQTIAQQLQAHQLSLWRFNLPAGNCANGERGIP